MSADEKYIVRDQNGFAKLLIYERKFLTEDKISGRPDGYYDCIRIDALKSAN